jgi:hypothetical protein
LAGLDVRVAFRLVGISQTALSSGSKYHTVIKMPLPDNESFQYWLVARVLKVASKLSAGVKRGALGTWLVLLSRSPVSILY